MTRKCLTRPTLSSFRSTQKLMSVMRSPKPCKPTLAFGYRVGGVDSPAEKEVKKAVHDKKGAVATKVLMKEKKDGDGDGTGAVRKVLAIARKKAMERNIVNVEEDEVVEQEGVAYDDFDDCDDYDDQDDYSAGSSSSHSDTLDSSLNTPSHNNSAAASSRFSVYADADADANTSGPATPPTVDTPYTLSNNDNSHYSLPPPSAMPPAPPVAVTEQSFSNMLDTSPMQDSPSLHQTGGSRRSVLASIDDGVRQSQEFLRR